MADQIRNTAWQTPIERMDQERIDGAADGAIAIVFNTTTNTLQYYDGNSFVDFGGGGGGGEILEHDRSAVPGVVIDLTDQSFDIAKPIDFSVKIGSAGGIGGFSLVITDAADTPLMEYHFGETAVAATTSTPGVYLARLDTGIVDPTSFKISFTGTGGYTFQNLHFIQQYIA